MRALTRLLDAVDRGSARIGRATGVLVPFVALAIVYEIVTRYVFRRPTIWASESTVFACAIVYLLAGAWLVQEDRHVRIDLLHDRLGPRSRALVDCLTFPAFALYVLVMLWASFDYAVESVRVRETTMSPWDPPIYPMKILLALSLALLFVQGLARFARNLLTVLGKTPR